MIQTFDVQGGPELGRAHLPLLREQLKSQGLDGFLVPHEDEYQNEYVPEALDRLMWASGFTGSAGAAVVRTDNAVMFTDGRYTLQVRAQVDGDLFAYERLESGGVAAWLRDNIGGGEVIGYDPKLHSPKAVKTLGEAIRKAGGTFKAVSENPIDAAWQDRPALPTAKLSVQPEDLAGESVASKRDRIAGILKERGADATVITAPASIAWLYNIRGGDVACTPLPLSTAIVNADGRSELYVNPVKLTDEVRSHLGNAVALREESDLEAGLSALSGQTVSVDPGTTSAWFVDRLQDAGAEVLAKSDPVALPKACKNKAEIKATTRAHERDAVPLIKFLHWLDTDAQSGDVDEIMTAVKLEELRRETGVLKDISFPSITGAAGNGAIVHYRVSTATNAKLSRGSLFLIDSGAQYPDGTTDVTRTVPIGEPTQEMRERFTLVLKGHIALAIVRFPEETTGSNLDVLARHALWQAGLDYDHGTGHGVGVYLGVHEGPQRISKMPNSVALEPGMIVSNEPGYYKTGEYGIRIENLQYVTEAEMIPGGERKMLGFQNLTLAPIHRDLIVVEMLSNAERAYMDAYHAGVLATVGAELDGEVKVWLQRQCAAL
jgi:Xaa-Pro aminopeptidase